MKNKPFNISGLHYSIEVLADILSQSKTTIGARIKRGELTLCAQSGMIPLEQVKEHPEIQSMVQTLWDDEHAVKPKRTYNLVELFAGGGGLAIGMEQAGLESVLLNEIDRHACNTLRHNRPNWNVIEGDISKVDFTQIKEDVDILTGGFPCQAFSYAGKSLGFENTRGTLFFEMARAIKETQPKIFMAENVKALFTHDEGRTLETIKSVIDELGYELVEPRVLKAIFYKVPQKRERLILVGIRKDLAQDVKFHWPSPCKRVMTLRDALYAGELYDTDVPESPGQEYPERKKESMAEVPQGGYWRDLSDELQREYMQKSYFLGGGKTGMARRLSLEEPSLTLTTSPAQKQTERCHPIHTRPLQVREYARIQTFPDNWEFQGSKNAAYKQIGNAVPVNMARALGHSLVKLLNDIDGKNIMSPLDIKVKQQLEKILKLDSRIDEKLNDIKNGDVSPYFLSLMGLETTLTYKLSVSLSTTFGMSFYEQVCEILAKEAGYEVKRQHKILGEVSTEVNEYLQQTLDNTAYIPDRETELLKIAELAGTGVEKEHPDSTVDVFIKLPDGTEVYIDITTVKPNKKEFRTMKRKLLTWTAMRLSVDPEAKVCAYMAIPYNPESGSYSRFSNCYHRKDLLVEDELWELVSGGKYNSKKIQEVFKSLNQEVTSKVKNKLDEVFNRN
ncbi:TdeIII family type II restriction endonuclease [Vibrio sp. NC2]|uniref:TdeIII family type II restriction endonuclease n=1 Tax=Vibrio sp. NC2 TaxID=2974562 RepID=UPI0021A2C100|nr:TdeIII family type II restriction endonuclease [Vibrio sp. NC2]MCT4348175.1 TdeIII family type II restriction endonuclease [Vibrio sp. NC2]